MVPRAVVAAGATVGVVRVGPGRLRASPVLAGGAVRCVGWPVSRRRGLLFEHGGFILSGFVCRQGGGGRVMNACSRGEGCMKRRIRLFDWLILMVPVLFLMNQRIPCR